MIEQTRRQFLHRLGIGVGALAFAPSFAWPLEKLMLFPKGVVEWSGCATPNWLVAEMLTAISRRLPDLALKSTPYADDDDRLREGERLLWCDPHLPPNAFYGFQYPQLEELRNVYIEPAAAMFAAEIAHFKPTYSGDLEVPGGIELACRTKDSFNGLRIRYARVFDISEGRFCDRFDVRVGR